MSDWLEYVVWGLLASLCAFLLSALLSAAFISG